MAEHKAKNEKINKKKALVAVNCNQSRIQDRIQIGPMCSQIQPSMQIIPTTLKKSGINKPPTFADSGLKSVIPSISHCQSWSVH